MATTLAPTVLSHAELKRIDAYWRAAAEAAPGTLRGACQATPRPIRRAQFMKAVNSAIRSCTPTARHSTIPI